MKRKITTYGNYFKEFYNARTPSAQEKIDYVFELVKRLNLYRHDFSSILKAQIACLKLGLNTAVISIAYFAFLMREM